MNTLLCKKEFGSDTPKWVFNRGGGIHPLWVTQRSQMPSQIGLSVNSRVHKKQVSLETIIGFSLRYKSQIQDGSTIKMHFINHESEILTASEYIILKLGTYSAHFQPIPTSHIIA